MFHMTSPIDLYVPTRGRLAVGTKSSFVFMVGHTEKFVFHTPKFYAMVFAKKLLRQA